MNAVIYARFSSSGQQEQSIEGQVRDAESYAERMGYTIVNTYADRAISGTTDQRPAFQRMIQDSAKGQFEIVLVWKLDRFARNRYDSARYKAQLKKNGGKVDALKGFIGADPIGELAANGKLDQSLDKLYDEAASAAKWAVKNAPALKTLFVKSDVYSNGGANDVKTQISQHMI